ncbi:MAG: hypothetical protein JXR10_00900, partial [Cyclobacteriaceae bacterium]
MFSPLQLDWGVIDNAKLAGVRPPLAESTNVAKLPNPHNSNYEALRSPDPRPEPQNEASSTKVSEWAVKRDDTPKNG